MLSKSDAENNNDASRCRDTEILFSSSNSPDTAPLCILTIYSTISSKPRHPHNSKNGGFVRVEGKEEIEANYGSGSEENHNNDDNNKNKYVY